MRPESEKFWSELFGLSAGWPGWATGVLVYFFLLLFFAVPICAFVAYGERKIRADLQARVGPNRNGPAGLAQPWLDVLKLLSKRRSADRPDLDADPWLLVVVGAVFSTLLVLPIGGLPLVVDAEMAAFVLPLVFLVASWAALFAGLEEGSVPAFFPTVRGTYQSLIGLAVSIVSLLTLSVGLGDFRLMTFASRVGAFVSPFHAVAGVLFTAGGLLLLRLPPFSEGGAIVQGGWLYHRPISGWRVALLRLAMHYSFFIWCCLTALVFLGGWSLPGSLSSALAGTPVGLAFCEAAWISAKALAIMGVSYWLAAANARLRTDQLTDLAWTLLLPLALLCLIGAVFWVQWFVPGGSA